MIATYIKTAWQHIRRVPFQALAAIFVLTITFFVITIISVLVYSSGQVLRYFETRPQVIAFLKDNISSDQVDKLRDKLSKDARVADIEYISKEKALEIYKSATSDNPLLSELVSPSIFPASLELSLTDLSHAQPLIDEIKKEEIVEQVGFTASLEGEESLPNVINRLKSFAFYIRSGGVVLAGFLVSTSLLVLIVIIGMRITTRREEIEILKLIGATTGFIRSPIFIEAVIYSLIGVFIGWFLAFILVLYSTPTLISYFGEITILPRNTATLFGLFGIIFFAELIASIILALFGSFIAVSRVKTR